MVAVRKISPVTKEKIDPSRRCPHIRELVDQRTSSYPLLRRAKYYHRICRHRLDLLCFHDEEELMCLCTTERHTNCFNFDFNMTNDCSGISNCKNGAQCFQDDRCPTSTVCVCPECFYGSECQFTSKGSVISLDVILGYSILPDVPFIRQSILVKVSTALTTCMLIVGLINGIFSAMTFRARKLREVGCGHYLLASSVISLLIVVIVTFKFVVFLFAQMSIIKNHTFLYINCISIDFISRSLLAMSDWLNASVSIERAFTTVKGVSFNKTKSCQIARFVIFIIIVFVFGSLVHDPIHRQLVEDDRIWCIIQYPTLQLEFFSSSIDIFHFILPFTTQIVSALVIILSAARLRASAQKQQSYRQHFREQWHYHKHLIFSSLVLILLAIPRLVLSSLSGCMESQRQPEFFLAGYFISIVPSLLTFVIYVLPSKTYKDTFDTMVKQYRRALFRLLSRGAIN